MRKDKNHVINKVFHLKPTDVDNMQKRYLQELKKKGYIERRCEFDPLSRADESQAGKFMSTFGDDYFYITDDDIDFLKKGGILGRLGEYGLLIIYDRKDVDNETES